MATSKTYNSEFSTRRNIGVAGLHYTFDFTKKFVQRTSTDGTRTFRDGRVDKFTLASMLDSIKYRYFVVGLMDGYTYAELKEKLLNDLENARFEDVTIIK